MKVEHGEEITQFLQRRPEPGDEEIEEFIEELKSSDPEIDPEEVKTAIRKRSQQFTIDHKRITELKERFSRYEDLEYSELPEFKSMLREAEAKHLRVEDASAEIMEARRLLDRIILKHNTLKRSTPDHRYDTPLPKVEAIPEAIPEKEEFYALEKKSEDSQPEREIEEVKREEEIKIEEEVKNTPSTQKKILSELKGRKTKEIIGEKGEEEKETIISKLKKFLKKDDLVETPYDPEIHGPLIGSPPDGKYTEVTTYWVNEPYAKVAILHNEETNTNEYHVIEPELTPIEETLLLEIKDRLRDALLVEEIENEEDKGEILTRKVKRLIRDYAITITPLQLEKILYYVKRDFIDYDKIDPLMHDKMIEDISANGHDIPIYLFHKRYQNIATNIVFSEEDLNAFIIRLAQRSGKHISIAEPLVDATMPDGSRIQMTLGTEVTAHGGTFTIRKFSEVPVTPIDLIGWNTFSEASMAYLWLCIENNCSIIFAGGTASGKTTSLNAVSLFVPPEAKIISIEDTRELKLPHPNWIPSVTRDSFTADKQGAVDMYELLRAALRQRPEYLLVGEVRGKEALTLFQAMSTGHTTFSTMHADSVENAIHRLENPPISVPRTMLQALNILSIQGQTYFKGKRVRRNLKLVEIIDIDPNTRNIRTNDIFNWDSMSDKFVMTGGSKALEDVRVKRGWTKQELNDELERRIKILHHMVEDEITEFGEVATIFRDYYTMPQKVLQEFGIE